MRAGELGEAFGESNGGGGEGEAVKLVEVTSRGVDGLRQSANFRLARLGQLEQVQSKRELEVSHNPIATALK